MKEVKPIKPKKQKAILPPQQSANDTSNWENRGITATTLDKTRTKRIVREVEFIKNTEPKGISPNQIRKELKAKGLKEKQIEQRLNPKSRPNKSSQ